MKSFASFLGSRHASLRKRKTIPDVLEMEKLGPFTFPKSTTKIVNDKLVHVGILKTEYAELEELIRIGISDEFLQTVVTLNDESSTAPRLRLYNWSVCNYTKEKPLLMEVNGKLVDPMISYNATLKRRHRTLFDPYRRGTLLQFILNGATDTTTVGQMLFIKWTQECGMDRFVTEHETEIREHLKLINSKRKTLPKKRIRELTENKTRAARIIKKK